MEKSGLLSTFEGWQGHWSNRSVLSLAEGADPVVAVTSKARQTVFRAMQLGWSGPPYDPFALAEILNILIEPSQDVIDARTFPASGGKFKIEFNPNRSSARINFSIAHEIAHTLFPDCAQTVRNRHMRSSVARDDWQLEALCNVGAAEILMPVGSFSVQEAEPVSIDTVLSLRERFSVSTEAVLLRIAKLTRQPCFVFAAHRNETKASPHYGIDYLVPSRSWYPGPRMGSYLPRETGVSECTAIGFTAKCEETWVSGAGPWRVECLGIAPYPGHLYPRVVGIVRPRADENVNAVTIRYLKGDATSPRGNDERIIVQIVNDKALTWGKGFAVAVRQKWPAAQERFTDWFVTSRAEMKLGNFHCAKLGDNLELVSLVAQHGYGPSSTPRIRYSALESALTKLAKRAVETAASVHMPRIGSGEAGGDWNIISEIIDETLCRKGIAVTVYALPGSKEAKESSSSGLLFAH